MMTKKAGRRSLVTLTTAALALSLLAGCGGNNNGGNSANGANSGDGGNAGTPAATESASTAAPAETGIDTSKKVELQFYMLGDAPKDLPIIQDEINKMAQEELNATVKFNYTSWTDWDQKYKLLLSSGQAIDLIFTADWTQYQSYAKRGAFLAIDDLLPKAAPELQKFVPESMWEDVKVDGKIYTVPATYKEYVTNGFVYREDLRKKYDLPVPKDLASYEAYMDGIVANEPDLMPMSLNSDIGNNLHYIYTELNKMVGALPYGMGVKYDSPTTVYSYWGSDEQKKS